MRGVRLIKKSYILGLIASLTLTGCSKASLAVSDAKINDSHNYINHQEEMEDDLVKVDFMDENFDMSTIEQKSCCD